MKILNRPVDVICEYCGSTIGIVPLDVKYQSMGWTARLVWSCPCCGQTNEIHKQNLPQSFIEEMQLKKDN